MQNFGVTNQEYYGMLWYFLEWSINGLSTTSVSTGDPEVVCVTE